MLKNVKSLSAFHAICLKDCLTDFDDYAIRYADKQCQRVSESCIPAP